jgi:hypothetical protein
VKPRADHRSEAMATQQALDVRSLCVTIPAIAASAHSAGEGSSRCGISTGATRMTALLTDLRRVRSAASAVAPD